jgi:hypothetical protein
VGAIFCIEASRLARNGRDWHHLIELCGMTSAVVVDPDGIYDPGIINDRLLPIAWLWHCTSYRADQQRSTAVNQGTIYPVLLKLEQEGAITSAWGDSENNRKARF